MHVVPSESEKEALRALDRFKDLSLRFKNIFSAPISMYGIVPLLNVEYLLWTLRVASSLLRSIVIGKRRTGFFSDCYVVICYVVIIACYYYLLCKSGLRIEDSFLGPPSEFQKYN